MKKIVISIAALCLLGCQKVVTDVDIPQTKANAVVFCQTGNIVKAQTLSLTKSKPVLNNTDNGSYEPIKDAIISISGNGRSVDYTLNPGSSLYTPTATMDYIAGVEYKLLISTSDYGNMSSTAIMPKRVSILDSKRDSAERTENVAYSIELTIADDPAISEYYLLEPFAIDENGDTTSHYGYRAYFTDEESEGGKITISGGAVIYKSNLAKSDYKLYMVVSSVTKEEYDFYKVYRDYDPENPFSEPTSFPFNIEGGSGLFSLRNSIIVPF